LSGGADMLLELLSLGTPAAPPLASQESPLPASSQPSLRSSLLDADPFAIPKGSVVSHVMSDQTHNGPASNADPFANLAPLSKPTAASGM